MKEVNIDQTMIDDEVETCPDCGNVYKVELLKYGDDYNDFGYRHCPFCGLITDEYANIS
jgi:uncharacterized Zn-finger protein